MTSHLFDAKATACTNADFLSIRLTETKILSAKIAALFRLHYVYSIHHALPIIWSLQLLPNNSTALQESYMPSFMM